jgi:iron complex outermembrane receptor protein
MKFHPRISPRAIVQRTLACSLFVFTCRSFAQEPAAAIPTGEEKAVKMEEFKVTADIDSYHEETSSMASKLPMELKELSSSLSIMNATSIKDRNAVTLTDVFNYVVGATQSQSNINGFSFRGFPNTGSYTQNIQFDGLLGATLKKAATSAANVDSLEFLKGPNGVLYGQMNPGGLLNIVTKSPEEIRSNYLRVTFGFYEGAFSSIGSSHSQPTKSISFDTTGAVFAMKHLFYRLVVYAANSQNSRPGNYDRNFSLYPSLTYKFNKDTAFTVKVEVSQNNRRQDDGVFPIFTNGTAYGDAATWYTARLNTVYQDAKDHAGDRGAALSTFFHTKLWGDWTLRIQSRAVWHTDIVREFTINNANVYSPTAKFATPTSRLRRQYNNVKNGHRYDYADANIYRDFSYGTMKNTVILGIGGGGEFFGNERLSFGPNQTLAQAIALTYPQLDQYAYPADGTGATNQQTYQTAFGEYFSDQMKIGDRLHLSVGIRHDRLAVHGRDVLKPATTQFATQITPTTKQAGVVYDLTADLSAYASYSQSIKPQTTIAFDIMGNSTFPPESGEQYETGLKFSAPTKNLNMTLAVYEIKRTNVVVPSGTNFAVATGAAQIGQAISRLDGGQQSKGLEFETQWQPMKNWQLQAGVAYSEATISASLTNPTTVGSDLANAPRLTGNLWTRYNIPEGKLKGLGFGTGVIYVGKAWAGDPTTTVYYRLPAWTRVDSSIYYRWDRYDLALNIQNLFDRRYIASAQSAITLNVGEQRKLTLSLGVKF